MEFGNYLNEGDINFLVKGNVQEGILLYAGLGSDTLAAGGVSAKRHQLRYVTSGALPVYTVGLGAELFERKLVGIAIRSLRLRSIAGGYLVATARVVGGGALESRQLIGTPTFGTRNTLKHSTCTVKMNAVQRETVVKAFEVNIENVLPLDDFYGANSIFLQRMEPENIRVTGRVECDFESAAGAALYDLMINKTPFEIDAVYTGQATGDATFPNDRLRVHLPRVTVGEDAVPNLDRQERKNVVLPFTAQYDNTATYVTGLDLDNTKLTVY